jgi:hypothetical protein
MHCIFTNLTNLQILKDILHTIIMIKLSPNTFAHKKNLIVMFFSPIPNQSIAKVNRVISKAKINFSLKIPQEKTLKNFQFKFQILIKIILNLKIKISNLITKI